MKLVREISKEWYNDPNSGGCLTLRIQTEGIPDTTAMEKMTKQSPAIESDPSAPLLVKVWTNKKEFKQSDKIKVYIKGNKPDYARALYKEASGETVQILPNVHRLDNYFNGGMIYEVSTGNDQIELEVGPPFGEENVIVYASSAPWVRSVQ